MQGILSLDDRDSKRRKTLRACQRCKHSKKRCESNDDSQRCRRCEDDDVLCSFLPEATVTNVERSQHQPPRPVMSQELPSPTICDPILSDHVRADSTAGVPATTDLFMAEKARDLQSQDDEVQGKKSEQRYATMLSLLGKDSAAERSGRTNTTKLISGTNPLSALLGKELKHKIVTNSCSFRTPDPTVRLPAPQRRGTIHSYDWETHYRAIGTHETRLQYLRSLGCFTLPAPAQCAHLLETYFTYIHPVLPILDRKELLSRYYGSAEPPSLVLLHAICLAAYRYLPSGPQVEGGVSEIRSNCDALHTKLHALVEAEMTTDRLAVVQASLLASLHWEDREGQNSAIHHLTLAVRILQELGFHRKQQQMLATERSSDELLQRRLWWCAYALDRFNAAQEGTPFIINEVDCDVDKLSEMDFAGEDQLTAQAALINVSLAHIIEDAVRNLYSPGEDHATLFSTRGLQQRQTLGLRLEQVATRIKNQLLSGQDVTASGLQQNPADTAALCGALLLTHLDAVRILVHRPFLLHQEPPNSSIYASRDACRSHAVEILRRLQFLLSKDLLRFSWPFSVYAVVNCLLIFWYDISSPVLGDTLSLSEARQNYMSVVNLLRVMGTTWWAAAAKHKLALALAHATGAPRPAPRLSGTGRSNTTNHAETGEHMAMAPLTPVSGIQQQHHVDPNSWPHDMNFADSETFDFWNSIGLDFDQDVANNIFSIGYFDNWDDQGAA